MRQRFDKIGGLIRAKKKLFEERGEISIFLALMFLIILATAFCVLEGIHAYENSMHTEAAFLGAGDTILSNYDCPLFFRYHVFFLDPREQDEATDDGLNYLEHYYEDGSFFGHTFSDLSMKSLVTATDYDGKVMKRQIEEWEKTKGENNPFTDFAQKLPPVTAPDVVVASGGGIAKEQEEDDDYAAEKILWKNLKESLEMVLRSGILLYGMDEKRGVSTLSVSDAALPSVTEGNISRGYPSIPILPSSPQAAAGILTEFGRLHLLIRTNPVKEWQLLAYAKENFGCYTKPDTRQACGLLYEKEYMIHGATSDQENLNAAVMLIFARRFFLNMEGIRHQEALCLRARFLAVRISGYDGLPENVEETETILLNMLSLGESLVELRSLLHGKNVPVSKDSGRWAVSFETVSDRLRAGETVDTAGTGVNYEDHLIYFMRGQEKELLYAMMDLMQINISLEEPGFLVKDCCYSFELQGRCSMPTWFHVIPGFGLKGRSFVKMDLKRIFSY